MSVRYKDGRFWAVLVLTAGLTAWADARERADPATPAEAVQRLRTGNALFVANPDAPLPITRAGRSALTDAEAPFAAVLSCADSRVPPEVIFHAGLGDLLVVRTAGHVADRSVLASLEYAVDHLRVPLIVVMGHESCGAVKTAAETPSTRSLGANLDYLLKAIRPAVGATASAPEAVRLRAAILKHVEDTMNEVLENSPALRRAAESGAVGLVGAFYELSTGRAHFSEPAVVGPSTSSRTAAR